MTVIISGDNGISDVDGSAGTPAIRGTDANTGIFFGADIIGFAEGGAECARFNADAQFVAAAGTASLPVLTTTGDLNTGIFFPAADTIAFAEGGAEAMRIDSSGNVGIGTSSPTTQLSISQGGNGNNLNVRSRAHLGATHSSASLVLGYSVKADTAAVDQMIGTETNSGGGAPAAILMNSGVIQFHTNSSITSGAAFSSERARITSGGALLVGTTTAAATAKVEAYKTGASTTCFLATQGDSGDYCYTSRAFNNGGTYYHFNFTEAGTQRGSITSNGSATAYNTGSDYRLKDNIAPLTGALATVLQLQPRTWTWKTNGSDGQGFVAHELAEVVPDCVTGEKDAVETYIDEDGVEQTRPVYQGVDTSFLVATLTAAIQEQQTIIDSLKARIETLEAK